MSRRLWKECRMLLVPWVPALVVVPLATWVASRSASLAMVQAWAIAVAIQYVLFQMMGVQLFASEFHHGTMPRLLTQPMSRVRIWREKLVALLVLLVIAASVSVLVGASAYRATVRYAVHNAPVPSAFSSDWTPQPFWQFISAVTGGRTLEGLPWASVNAALATVRVDDIVRHGVNNLNLGLVICMCGFLGALCCGPFMALALRQGHTAFWATLVAPIVYLLAMMIGVGMVWPAVSGVMQHVITFILYPLPDAIVDSHGGEIFVLLPWFIAMYVLGRRRFLGLEV